MAEQNLLIATKTFWSILLVSASLLNALNFSGPLRRFVSVFWSFLFRTPVLIGDLDDPRNEVLAVSMAIHARAKKIKMVMIHRHGVLRAYFKNDEEAVLIRASS